MISVRIDTTRLKGYHYEMGPIRPPSEGQDRSLLIRATRHCPWNRCEFCHTYKGQKFEYRRVEEIKQDIDVARGLAEEIKAASWKLGLGGKVNQDLLVALVRGTPEVYGPRAAPAEELKLRVQSLSNVGGWLSSGGRTAFLQDANTLIMRTPELVEVIRYLKSSLPSIERVTSYGRAKTAAKKSPEEMAALREAGLSRLHMGLESGCDEVLAEMQKGVTAEEHILGGRRVVEAGISLSEYVMPGLGGRKWSEKHALETARVLNATVPDFIRLRSLVIRRGSGLFDKFHAGEFQCLSEDEVVDEIGLLVENLNCHSYVASDQMSNLLWEIEGQLPEDKPRLLATVQKYQSLPPLERLKLRLGRRLNSYLGVYGQVPPEVSAKVQEALSAIDAELPWTGALTDAAIDALKQGFI